MKKKSGPFREVELHFKNILSILFTIPQSSCYATFRQNEHKINKKTRLSFPKTQNKLRQLQIILMVFFHILRSRKKVTQNVGLRKRSHEKYKK